MKIYTIKNGQQAGPFTLEQIQGYLAHGEITLSELAWSEGQPDWVPLSQLIGKIKPVNPAPTTPVFKEYPTAARLLTAVVLFFPISFLLFCAFFVGVLFIMGAYAGMNDPNHASEAGRAIGEKYTGIVFLLSLFVSVFLSAVISLIAAFSNLFPWCRPK